jgi:GAF domain-containing protein
VHPIPLGRLLNKRQVQTLLETSAGASPHHVTLGLADQDGRWVVVRPAAPEDDLLVRQVRETRQPASDEHAIAVPLIVQDDLYGVLYCSPAATPACETLHRALAILVENALTQKSLAKETLDRYREINLLYRIHETIGSSLVLSEVVRRILEESTRIIKAEGGSVLLEDGLTGGLVAQDSFGLDVARAEQDLIGLAFSHKVARDHRSRILNNLDRFVRLADREGEQLSSLLCAPLRSGSGVLGVITLGSTRHGVMFTAGDQKLLTALATQAGVAIANAQEVEAREERLKRQIEALRIEIDEGKRQREVYAITESEYFAYLQENAQRMRAEFEV